MTTLRPPLLSAVRVAVPLTPLLLTSTSLAFTVVSAAALVGRHIRAAAAATMSALRNLVMYPPSSVGAPRVRGDAMSCHSISPVGTRCLKGTGVPSHRRCCLIYIPRLALVKRPMDRDGADSRGPFPSVSRVLASHHIEEFMTRATLSNRI